MGSGLSPRLQQLCRPSRAVVHTIKLLISGLSGAGDRGHPPHTHTSVPSTQACWEGDLISWAQGHVSPLSSAGAREASGQAWTLGQGGMPPPE